MFRALPRFDADGDAKLGTWIRRIASNLAIDELRKRPPSRHEDGAAISAVAGVLAAEDATHGHELAVLVAVALEELPPEYRAAFVLREYEDYDYAEIAVMLDIDLGTVKSRMAES